MEPESEAAPPPAEDTEAEEDFLDLTDVVQEDGTVVSLNREAAPEPAPMEPEPMEPEPEPTMAEPEAESAPAPAPMTSPVASGTAADAFAALSEAVHATGIPMGKTERTLEDLIRELLRPMLTEWLDKNLNPIVTQAAEREISRLSGRVDKD